MALTAFALLASLYQVCSYVSGAVHQFVIVQAAHSLLHSLQGAVRSHFDLRRWQGRQAAFCRKRRRFDRGGELSVSLTASFPLRLGDIVPGVWRWEEREGGVRRPGLVERTPGRAKSGAPGNRHPRPSQPGSEAARLIEPQ